MNDNFHKLQSHLASVHQQIRWGRQTLEAGKEVDLHDLGDEVRKTCDAIQNAFDLSEISKIDRETLAQKLNDIIADLSKLEEEVVQHHSIQSRNVELKLSETD